MNLLLLHPSDVSEAGDAIVTARQSAHIRSILKLEVNDSINIGIVGGDIGTAKIAELRPDAVVLTEIKTTLAPPPPLPLCLILALPRPRVLNRLLQTVTSLGVTQLHLLQSARVEKSYWQTPLLAEDSVREQLLLGLEQACATQLPTIHHHRRFTPFIDDVLPALVRRYNRALIAHPRVDTGHVTPLMTETILAIGPEGGFLPKEVATFERAQFTPFSLGQRVLKTETAVPVALTRLFPVV